MSEIKDLGLKKIVQMIQSKDLSGKEVWDYYQERISRYDSEIEAFNYVEKEFQEVDTALKYAGLPIAIKDLYSETGKPNTASSKILEDYRAPYESTATRKLKDLGVTSIGRVNCDEFAMGTTGENSAYRVTKNPWDISKVPGGSSSGSAASVAAKLVPAALGTDTGGSIRQPAGLSGAVGFKGTYGRVSRYGVIPMASSFDTMGVVTNSVEDAAFLWEGMVGKDPMDATSLSDDLPDTSSIWTEDRLDGLKIGVPKEYFVDGLDQATRSNIEKSLEALKSLGADVREISLPLTEYGIASYYVLIPSEASTNLGRFDGIRFGHKTDKAFENYADYISESRTEGFGPEPLRRIMIGTHALSAGFYDAYYKKAALVRQMVRDEFADAFSEVDVIVSPVSPTVAWDVGEKADDPVALYLADIFTIPGALAGLPGLTLPCGFSEDKQPLPVGLQIMGPRLGEEKVFRVGHVFEQAVRSEVSQYKHDYS